MNISQALRYTPPSSIALVGSGGKTTLLFQLARELVPPVITAATSHLHTDQIKLADSHWKGTRPEDLAGLEANLLGVMLVTGPVIDARTQGLNSDTIGWLYQICKNHALPLLIEADGSRQHPLKAPADHEPPIPDFVKMVVVVAGMSGIGKPLTGKTVHNLDLFSALSKLAPGEMITPEALVQVLTHVAGGFKNIPRAARRVVLLNQADTSDLQSQGQAMAEGLLPGYHSVVIASLQQSQVYSVYEPTAIACRGSQTFRPPQTTAGLQRPAFCTASGTVRAGQRTFAGGGRYRCLRKRGRSGSARSSCDQSLQ